MKNSFKKNMFHSKLFVITSIRIAMQENFIRLHKICYTIVLNILKAQNILQGPPIVSLTRRLVKLLHLNIHTVSTDGERSCLQNSLIH